MVEKLVNSKSDRAKALGELTFAVLVNELEE